MKPFTIMLIVCLFAGCSLREQLKKEVSGEALQQFLETSDQGEVVENSSKPEISEITVINQPEQANDNQAPDIPEKENDLKFVDKWLNVDVSEWNQTVNITAYVKKRTLYIDCDKMDWPKFKSNGKDVFGCVWAVMEIDGKWYASTWEFFKSKNGTRDISKICTKESAADHFWGYGKMNGWYLKPGIKIYVFVTPGNVRANYFILNERSNIAEIVIK